MDISGWFWRLLEDYVYALPEPPPRKRTKPMEVLCVGMPRTGTESLQKALLTLGYDYTYHGWDVIFEEPNYSQQWARLARKKWPAGHGSKEATTITAADFDAVLGHSVAVADVASGFAAELIAAYPNAKVVLNYRKNLDAWHRSTMRTLLSMSNNPESRFGAFLTCKGFWKRHFFLHLLYPVLFRSADGSCQTGIASNAKWAHQVHSDMIRSLVPKERLLEWAIEDGWEPLCEFLGKPVPNEPFPHVNLATSWTAREQKIIKVDEKDAEQNVRTFLTMVIVSAGAALYYFFWCTSS